MGKQGEQQQRVRARLARWLDPDSLDVCAWADTGEMAVDAVVEDGEDEDDETPPPSFSAATTRPAGQAPVRSASHGH